MQNFNEKALAVTAEVSKAVLGKPEVVLKIMMAMLARGHVLIEDIPGVGKTTLAQAFARAMDLTQNRVQFTPDVLPSDFRSIKRKPASLSTTPARSRATCFWLMRSTVPVPAPSPPCWRSWRRAPSRWTV